MFPVPPPPELAQFYGPPDPSAPASVAIVVAETEGTGSESSEQQSVSEEESQSDEPLVEISSEPEAPAGDSSPVPPIEAPVDDPPPAPASKKKYRIRKTGTAEAVPMAVATIASVPETPEEAQTAAMFPTLFPSSDAGSAEALRARMPSVAPPPGTFTAPGAANERSDRLSRSAAAKVRMI